MPARCSIPRWASPSSAAHKRRLPDPQPWLEPAAADGGQSGGITGATSGLGLAAADGFARLGAAVWLAVRSSERGKDARARIFEHIGEADVHVELGDLSRLRSVRKFAERFAARAPRLDVLISNADVLTQERELSADGIELTLATNVVGPFCLPNC